MAALPRPLRPRALAHAGKAQRRIVSAWIGAAYAEADADRAKRQWRRAANQLRPKVPKLATLMDSAEEDLRAYMNFPAAHRTKLHSTDPIERLNGEIKCRTDVVASSPTRPPSCALSAPFCSNSPTNWPPGGRAT